MRLARLFQNKVWLGIFIPLGLLVSLSLSFYYQFNHELHFAFASDQDFKVQLDQKTLRSFSNGLVLAPTQSLPFTQVIENAKLDLSKQTLNLVFEKAPSTLKLVSYQKVLVNPFKLVFYHYYALLPSSLKYKLLWFEEEEVRIKYSVLHSLFFPQEQQELSLNLNSHLLKISQTTLFQKFLETVRGLWVYFFSMLGAAVVTLPLLFIKKKDVKALLALVSQAPILFLLILLALSWGVYTYQLTYQAGFFTLSLLQGLMCFSCAFLLGFAFYTTLLLFVMNFIANWPYLLRALFLVGFLVLDMILLIQAGFLYFTANHISHDYFAMLNWQTSSFLFSPLSYFVIASVVILGLYLLAKQSKISYSLASLFLLYPFLWLFSCSLAFGSTLPFLNKGIPVYCSAHPAEKLSFNSYLEPFLGFSRELIRHYKLAKLSQEDLRLDFQTFSKTFEEASLSCGLNLGEESSTYPAGKRPFKRIILLTIEGYRLAYIPQYNPALRGLMKDYPFFDREEVQKGFVPNYYACATYTMRALLSLLSSHMNAPRLRQSWNSLPTYPALPRVLSEKGFSTFFIQTAQPEFDQFQTVFKGMGIQRYLDLHSMDFVTAKDHAQANLENPYAWLYPSRLLFKEVIGQLKRAKESQQDIFTLIINTDTHVPPVGMAMTNPAYYGSLTYPDPSSKDASALGQDVINTLTSTYRFAYDLDLFFEQLQQEGLWDEETLFIVTADHSQLSLNPSLFPKNAQVNRMDKLPLFILSARPLPKIDQDIYASHIDLAPTILDLMGLDKPAGYWGRSLYSPLTKKRRAWFGGENDKALYSLDQSGLQEWSLVHEGPLKELFENFLLKNPPDLSLVQEAQ